MYGEITAVKITVVKIKATGIKLYINIRARGISRVHLYIRGFSGLPDHLLLTVHDIKAGLFGTVGTDQTAVDGVHR